MKKVGEVLKKTRQAKGLSLGEIEKAIRVRKKYLEALEKGDYGNLPGFSYAQGFVRVYARYLGLSVEKILAFLRREYPVEKINVLPRMGEEPGRRIHFKITPQWTTIIGAGLILLLFFSWLFWQVKSLAGAPKLVIVEPRDKAVVSLVLVLVKGKTEPQAQVKINGQEIRVDEKGDFAEQIDLSPGLNEIVVEAKSKMGKTLTKKIQIRSEP